MNPLFRRTAHKLLLSTQTLAVSVVVFAACLSLPAQAVIAQAPLLNAQTVPPLVLLTLGRDEKLSYAAYNDYSDIDGDGFTDTGYKPAITYFGYFDSFKCYDYITTGTDAPLFRPMSTTTTKKCTSKWSGDFLNYLTTSRMDALRRVLYGGKRVVDTATKTVIERAFIPQDLHVWGREYDANVDTYLVTDYTPLAQPTAGTRHFFANVSRNADTSKPLLRVMVNRKERIWNWIAKEGPVAEDALDAQRDPLVIVDYSVRVEACVTGLLEPECKGYPAAAPTSYKPTGILHDYGENRSIAFGLLTGSYQNQRSGGVLRKNVSFFDDEIVAADGTFNSSVAGIVDQINRLRIAQFDPSARSYPGNCDTGNCKDFGSPTAEMMYEGLRYFGGASGPVSAFNYTESGSVDYALGLVKATWADPYRTTTGGFPYCAKPVQMVFSDVYPSYDTDELPGSQWGTFSAPASPSTLSALNVSSVLDTISAAEGIGGQYFIGESKPAVSDRAPTLKTVTTLSKVRGLAPAEPIREGGYYAASIARFGKVNDVNNVTKTQNVTTYAVALSAPLPKLSFTYNGSKVSLIPFAQSVGGCDYGGFKKASTSPLQNRIAAFFIDKIVNIPGFATDGTVNGGRPSGAFRVSYEDNMEGTDSDMDSIASYTFAVNGSGALTVTINSEYNAGCILQHMGYVISGTTADGAYLGVRDIGTSDGNKPACAVKASLDDPSNSTPINATAGCVGYLGFTYSRTFSLAAAGAAVDGNIPRDPLFYAAKWGGPCVGKLADCAQDNTTDLTSPATETAINGLASVGGYYYVSDPFKLRAQLTKAFDLISASAAPTISAAATGAFARSDSQLFFPGYKNATMNSTDVGTGENASGIVGVTVWDGELRARKFATTTGTPKLVDDWAVTNASFGTVDSTNKTSSRVIYTLIGTDKTARLLPANIDPTLRDKLVTSAITATLQPVVDALLPIGTPIQKKKEAADILAMYLLGDRSLEQRRGGVLRSRRNLLADIVNSSPAYQGPVDNGWANLKSTIAEGSSYSTFVKNTKSAYKTIYTGANGGLLHAFNSANGNERWAFLPTMLQSEVAGLAKPGYSHRYFVDGQLTVQDAYFGGSWKSVLVAALGAGGKTLFAIDVTNQDAPKVLWEFTHEDFGYALGRPQVVRLLDGTWAVVIANGYESARVVSSSTTTVARLFVIDLNTGTSLGTAAKLTVKDQGVVNGLASPAIKTINGIAQAAWAGDLAGNLWKFAFTTTDKVTGAQTGTASSIKIAYSSGSDFAPLFSATVPGNPQPITSEPSLVPFPEGGDLLVFGTGKLFETTDLDDVKKQSVYAVWDRSRWQELTRSNLTAVGVTDSGIARFVSSAAGAWWANSSANRGWYIDLPTSGERVITSPITAFATSIFSTLVANNADKCVINQDGLLMGVDAYTASNPTAPIFDLPDSSGKGDGKFDTGDLVGGKVPAGIKLTDPVSLVAVNTGENIFGFKTDGAPVVKLTGGNGSGRRSWRQIQ